MHTKRSQMLKLQNLFQTHQDHFRDMFSYFHDHSTWISRVMAEKPPKFGQNSEFQNTSWKWTSPSGRRLILSLWHWESSKHTALIKFWTFISRFHWDIYSQIRRFCHVSRCIAASAFWAAHVCIVERFLRSISMEKRTQLLGATLTRARAHTKHVAADKTVVFDCKYLNENVR